MSGTPGKPRQSGIPTPGKATGIPTPGRLRSFSSSTQHPPQHNEDVDFASRAFADAMKAHDPALHRHTRPSDVSAVSLSPQSAAFTSQSGRKSATGRPSSAASTSSALSSITSRAPGIRPKTPSARPPSRQSDVFGRSVSRAGGRGFEIGDSVRIESLGYEGTLRYIGDIAGKPGTWAGVELSGGFAGKGKNDGAVNGVQYFTCPPHCGVFIAVAKLSRPTIGIGAISRPSSVASIRSGRATPSYLSGRVTPSLSTNGTPAITSTSVNRASGRITPSASAGRRTPGIAKSNSATHSKTPAPASDNLGSSRSVIAESKITPGSRASRYIGVTARQLNSRESSSPTRKVTGAMSPTRSSGLSSPTYSARNLSSPTRTSGSPFTTPKPNGRIPSVGVGLPSTTPSKSRTSLSTPRARIPSAIAMPPPSSPSRISLSRTVSLNEQPYSSRHQDEQADDVGRSRSMSSLSSLESSGRALQEKISHLISGKTTPSLSLTNSSPRPDSSASGRSLSAAGQHSSLDLLQARLDAVEYEKNRLVVAAESSKATEERLLKTVSDLQGEREEIRQRVSDLESQLKVTERSAHERESKVEALERALEQSAITVDKVKNDSDSRIKGLQSKVDDGETLIKELKEAIEAQKGAECENDALINAKNTEIVLLETRVQKVTLELEEERRELGAQVDELRRAGQETIALYEERLSSADARRYEMEDLVAVLENQLRSHPSSRSDDASATASSSATLIDNEALRDQVQYLQRKVSNLEDVMQENHAKSEREENIIREKLRRYKEKEESIKKELEDGRTELDKAVRAEDTLKGRVQELEEALRESTVALENAQAEIEGLRGDLANYEGLDDDSPDKSLDHAQRGLNERARLHEEITRLKQELDDARKERLPADFLPDNRQLATDETFQAQLLIERANTQEFRQLAEQRMVELETLRKKLNRDLPLSNGRGDPSSSSSSKHDSSASRQEITGLKHIVQELQKDNLAIVQQNKVLTAENKLLLSETEKLREEIRSLEDNFEQSLLREERELNLGDSVLSSSDASSLQRALNELRAKQEVELEQLRKRHADAEMKSARVIHDLNKEVSELETLVESKIYREDELEREVDRLKDKLSRGQKKSSKSSIDPGEARLRVVSDQGPPPSIQGDVCEICERPGHDIFSCDLLKEEVPKKLQPLKINVTDPSEMYCEDCETHGHLSKDCPHSLDVF